MTKPFVYLALVSAISDKHILLALEASRDAAAEILKVREGKFGVIQKEDDSPVTIADYRSNECITNKLLETNIPILSEEGEKVAYATRAQWSQYWLVDPLDGTKSFIRGREDFAICIALIQNNLPVFGIVALPCYNSLYIGYGDKYGRLDNFLSSSFQDWNSELIIPEKDESNDSMVVSSMKMEKELKDYINAYVNENGLTRVFQASAAYKFCILTEGDAKIYPRFRPCMEWDTAAGHAILKAQGMNIYKMGTEEEIEYNKAELFNPPFVAY